MSLYKELTIGAVVIHGGIMKTVTGMTQDFVYLGDDFETAGKIDIKPVRITGEFLLKHGFETDESINRILRCEAYKTPDGHISVRKIASNRERSWNIHIDNENCNTIANADVEYLHQMQTELANQGIDFKINL